MAAKKLAFFPTIGRTIRETFKEIYNSFTYSTLTSLVSAICYVPILLVISGMLYSISEGAKNNLPLGEISGNIIFGLFLTAIWNTFIASPVNTTIYGLYQNRKESYPGFKTFFIILWKYYRTSVAVNGFFSLVFVLLFINMLIALVEHSTFLTIIGMFSFYLIIFLMLMSFYFAPLICLENGFKKTLRKAFLLVLDNTSLTIGLMLALGIFFMISLLTVIIWPFIYGAISTYITDFGFNAIYARYDD